MHNLVGGASAKRSVEPTQLGLKPLNVIVWAKNNVGMGSLYRSQNELLPLLKKGTAPHVNNIELGKRGRWRSSLDSHACRGLKDHPTVKPTAMLEDALLDLSNRSDIVVDPFLGSGSTLIAADKTSLSVRGVELDPLYVHVIVRLTGARRRSLSLAARARWSIASGLPGQPMPPSTTLSTLRNHGVFP